MKQISARRPSDAGQVAAADEVHPGGAQNRRAADQPPPGTSRTSGRQAVPSLFVAMMACLGILVVMVASLTGCGQSQAPSSPAQASAIPTVRVIPPSERGEYLGNSACVTCHPKQAAQTQTRHARTLQQVTADVHAKYFSIPARLLDPLEELTFHPQFKGGRCVIQATGPQGTSEAAADYAFGSGAIGYTFLSYAGGRPTELRISHYVNGSRWEFTPGQRMGGQSNSPVGQVLSPNHERTCFACHSTVLVSRGAGLDLQQSIAGVSCEGCHGPGRSHVEAVRIRAPDHRMARLSTMRERLSLELCGQCHRAPDNVDLHAPGMAVQLPRMQSVALSYSACFKKGGLTCVTCHNPHGDAASVTHTEYNAKCVSCHSGPAPQRPCPVQPQGDCVNCHMPSQDVGMPTSPRFRNHWIRAW